MIDAGARVRVTDPVDVKSGKRAPEYFHAEHARHNGVPVTAKFKRATGKVESALPTRISGLTFGLAAEAITFANDPNLGAIFSRGCWHWRGCAQVAPRSGAAQ